MAEENKRLSFEVYASESMLLPEAARQQLMLSAANPPPADTDSLDVVSQLPQDRTSQPGSQPPLPGSMDAMTAKKLQEELQALRALKRARSQRQEVAPEPAAAPASPTLPPPPHSLSNGITHPPKPLSPEIEPCPEDGRTSTDAPPVVQALYPRFTEQQKQQQTQLDKLRGTVQQEGPQRGPIKNSPNKQQQQQQDAVAQELHRLRVLVKQEEKRQQEEKERAEKLSKQQQVHDTVSQLQQRRSQKQAQEQADEQTQAQADEQAEAEQEQTAKQQQAELAAKQQMQQRLLAEQQAQIEQQQKPAQQDNDGKGDKATDDMNHAQWRTSTAVKEEEVPPPPSYVPQKANTSKKSSPTVSKPLGLLRSASNASNMSERSSAQKKGVRFDGSDGEDTDSTNDETKTQGGFKRSLSKLMATTDANSKPPTGKNAPHHSVSDSQIAPRMSFTSMRHSITHFKLPGNKSNPSPLSNAQTDQSFHSQSNSKHSKKQGSEDTSSSDGAESVSDYEGIDSSEGNVTAGKVSKKEEGLAKQLVQRSRKSVDMMRHVLHLGGGSNKESDSKEALMERKPSFMSRSMANLGSLSFVGANPIAKELENVQDGPDVGRQNPRVRGSIDLFRAKGPSGWKSKGAFNRKSVDMDSYKRSQSAFDMLDNIGVVLPLAEPEHEAGLLDPPAPPLRYSMDISAKTSKVGRKWREVAIKATSSRTSGLSTIGSVEPPPDEVDQLSFPKPASRNVSIDVGSKNTSDASKSTALTSVLCAKPSAPSAARATASVDVAAPPRVGNSGEVALGSGLYAQQPHPAAVRATASVDATPSVTANGNTALASGSYAKPDGAAAQAPQQQGAAQGGVQDQGRTGDSHEERARAIRRSLSEPQYALAQQIKAAEPAEDKNLEKRPSLNAAMAAIRLGLSNGDNAFFAPSSTTEQSSFAVVNVSAQPRSQGASRAGSKAGSRRSSYLVPHQETQDAHAVHTAPHQEPQETRAASQPTIFQQETEAAFQQHEQPPLPQSSSFNAKEASQLQESPHAQPAQNGTASLPSKRSMEVPPGASLTYGVKLDSGEAAEQSPSLQASPRSAVSDAPMSDSQRKLRRTTSQAQSQATVKLLMAKLGALPQELRLQIANELTQRVNSQMQLTDMNAAAVSAPKSISVDKGTVSADTTQLGEAHAHAGTSAPPAAATVSTHNSVSAAEVPASAEAQQSGEAHADIFAPPAAAAVTPNGVSAAEAPASAEVVQSVLIEGHAAAAQVPAPAVTDVTTGADAGQAGNAGQSGEGHAGQASATEVDAEQVDDDAAQGAQGADASEGMNAAEGLVADAEAEEVASAAEEMVSDGGAPMQAEAQDAEADNSADTHSSAEAENTAADTHTSAAVPESAAADNAAEAEDTAARTSTSSSQGPTNMQAASSTFVQQDDSAPLATETDAQPVQQTSALYASTQRNSLEEANSSPSAASPQPSHSQPPVQQAHAQSSAASPHQPEQHAQMQQQSSPPSAVSASSQYAPPAYAPEQYAHMQQQSSPQSALSAPSQGGPLWEWAALPHAAAAVPLTTADGHQVMLPALMLVYRGSPTSLPPSQNSPPGYAAPSQHSPYTPPLSQGPNSYPQGPNPYLQGPNSYTQGPNSYTSHNTPSPMLPTPAPPLSPPLASPSPSPPPYHSPSPSPPQSNIAQSNSYPQPAQSATSHPMPPANTPTGAIPFPYMFHLQQPHQQYAHSHANQYAHNYAQPHPHPRASHHYSTTSVDSRSPSADLSYYTPPPISDMQGFVGIPYPHAHPHLGKDGRIGPGQMTPRTHARTVNRILMGSHPVNMELSDPEDEEEEDV